MKNFTRIAVLLLVLCQLLLCFTACKNGQSGDEESSAETAFELTKEQLASYKIVVSETNSMKMNPVATKLQESIESFTGVKLEIKTDKVVEGSDTFCESEYEILIGSVGREESREFHRTVKSDDYGYALAGKKILIVGHSQETADKSVTQFRINILEKMTDGALLKSGDSNITRGKYKYDTLTLCGKDISEYTIVYSQWNDKGEKDVATYLQGWITEKTGYVLPIESDITEAEGSEIMIGDVTHATDAMRADMNTAGYAAGKSYLAASDGRVWLMGANRTAIYLAFTRLLDTASYSDGNMTLSLDAPVCSEVKELDISVMSYNVYYDLSEKNRNPDDVIASVNEKAPDVFGLNEAGKDWIDKFNADADIKSAYACAEGKPTDKADDASYNPIFYKKDKFELVESGTKWLSSTPDVMSKYSDAKHYKILTYAILKDKASGAEFMYVNVHLDGSGDSAAHTALAEVRKKQVEVVKSFAADYVQLPIIVGGDFNASASSAVIASMGNGRFKYCMNMALDTVNINSTDVNSEFNSITSGVIFDYIFVSTDCVGVKKYEQWDNKTNGKYPSDHLPVIAQVTVKY